VDERLQAILAGIGRNEIAEVAANAIGGSVAVADVGAVSYEEIRRPHSDPRTIGIVRVSGTATAGGGAPRPWSAVTKLVDLKVPNTLGTSVDPENEVRVYEGGCFANLGLRLRPAACYHVSRPREGLTILWLEDLTGTDSAPFSLDALSEMARHLGQWNAAMAAAPPVLGFGVGQDFQWASSHAFNFPQRIDALKAISNEPIVRAMYARRSLTLAAELVSAYGLLIERSLRLPHFLALADCPIGNFFHRPGETIAIDWAGLGNEPVGSDGGRFIGSATTWGRGFAEVVRHERHLFDSYFEGQRDGGSRESRGVLRAGYLSEAAYYLCTIVTLPTLFAGPLAKLPLEFFERRLEMPVEAFGDAFAEVIELLPPYIDEMLELTATTDASRDRGS
jgi:hypothetical protein